MFNKYYEIRGCYERENNDSKAKEVVIICNEIKWKGILSSYTNYFTLSPEDFIRKFGSSIVKDDKNFGLVRKTLEVGVDYIHDLHGITNTLPESLK